VKAITLYQPYASAVVYKLKRFETRSWPTSHRGLLAIHASKKKRSDVARELTGVGYGLDSLNMELLLKVDRRVLEWNMVAQSEFPALGCIVGLAEVRTVQHTETARRLLFVDELELRWGDFSDGRFAWELVNRTRLETPVPCRGAQGLWNVPFDVEQKILDQVKCLAWPLKFL
jgi:hypothetical protein